MDRVNSFPGYEFILGEDNKMHNMYRGEDVGLGGYVYAEPGMYSNVYVLDSASHHPSSIIAMNMFGNHTHKFRDLLEARIAIKHKEFDKARTMLGGKLTPYLSDENTAADLSQALKIALNSAYGLTASVYDTPFRDIRNKNNIVALRGALFIVDLKYAVQEKGYSVIHCKTDSIKIPDATQEIIDFVMEFSQRYGYTFEIEEIYERFCLVNNAVYIARMGEGKHKGEWTATGTQFAQPVVFKTLFSHESLVYDDYCETKSVKNGKMYLDFNENLPEEEHNYKFVGAVGRFVPVKENTGGGILVVKRDTTGKYDAVNGTKGWRWKEAEVMRLENRDGDINLNYHRKFIDEAIEDISQFGDFEQFIA